MKAPEGKNNFQLTQFGYEQKEHDDGGGNGDYAAGEGSSVEVFVDLRVSVQIPQLEKEGLHRIDRQEERTQIAKSTGIEAKKGLGKDGIYEIEIWIR